MKILIQENPEVMVSFDPMNNWRWKLEIQGLSRYGEFLLASKSDGSETVIPSATLKGHLSEYPSSPAHLAYAYLKSYYALNS